MFSCVSPFIKGDILCEYTISIKYLCKVFVFFPLQKHAEHVRNWEVYIEKFRSNFKDHQVSF